MNRSKQENPLLYIGLPAPHLTSACGHSRRFTAVTAMLLAKSPVLARPGDVPSRTWPRPATHPQAVFDANLGATRATMRTPCHSRRDTPHGAVTNPGRGPGRGLTPIWAWAKVSPVTAP